MHVATPHGNPIQYTIEPLNKGHFGNGPFVLCSEVVLISEVCHILTLNNLYYRAEIH